jgi:hypothetical protein
MFTLEWTEEAKLTFNRLQAEAGNIQQSRKDKAKKKSSRQEGLFKQVIKTLKLLRENPKHPGLKTHPYSLLEHPWSSKEKVFEAYVQNNTPGAYRVFWCYGPGKKEITIIAITAHP